MKRMSPAVPPPVSAAIPAGSLSEAEPRSAGPRTIKAAKLDRERTLEAVMRCFWAHGYEATSIGRLERASGLGRQSLYNAFGDKEALFAAAHERYREQVGAPLWALLDQDEPASAIRAFLLGHLEMMSDPATPSGCLITNCSSELGPRDDALGERMRAETQASTEGLRIVFSRWKESGKLSADADPQALAALLAAISRGLAVIGRASAQPALVAQAVHGAVQAFAPFFSLESPPPAGTRAAFCQA